MLQIPGSNIIIDSKEKVKQMLTTAAETSPDDGWAFVETSS